MINYCTGQGTSGGKIQCCHGNHINYRMLLKLINAARQQPYFAKGVAVALGYSDFKKKPEAVGLRQSWFVGYFKFKNACSSAHR